jgi:DEAD/DEAH box helicase
VRFNVAPLFLPWMLILRDCVGFCSPIGHTLLSVHLRRFSRCSGQRLPHILHRPTLSDDPKTLSLSHLDSLVIDEADLILSYGHDEDIRSIFSGNFLPKVYQSFLMSATMADDVEILKGLALRSPVCLMSCSYSWNSDVDAPGFR